MRNESELIRLYADDVLRACIYYLEDRKDAENAFQETFALAHKRQLFGNENALRINLFKVVREVCGALYFPDDGEEWLYTSYFGLTLGEAADILGRGITHRKLVMHTS